VHWSAPRAELSARASEIAKRIADLPPAALAASKACIAAACQPGRGGYTDELEFTRSLLTNPETQKRVTAFLTGATESSTQNKSGAAR
jgi:enoyl-CoA hydratase/carnithine racemase